MKYSINEVTDYNKWDSLVNESPQGTVFSLHPYLQASGNTFKLFEIKKGNQLRAGLSIVLNNDETSCKLDDLVIYNGLFFLSDKNQKKTKGYFERFEITEFIINELTSLYNDIELALSPFFEDIRPFLWHNYHSPLTNTKFKIDVRYTSYLDISEFKKDKPDEDYLLFKNLETLRQRNIREARQTQGIHVVADSNVSVLLNYYQKLMLSQNKRVTQTTLDRMQELIVSLLKNKMAIQTLTKNNHGEILYSTLFCFDHKRAYYLFGAGNPQNTDRFKGTITFWDSFKILNQKFNISEVDLEGVNSPQRGWFKLSLGGNLKPYYHVALHS